MKKNYLIGFLFFGILAAVAQFAEISTYLSDILVSKNNTSAEFHKIISKSNSSYVHLWKNVNGQTDDLNAIFSGFSEDIFEVSKIEDTEQSVKSEDFDEKYVVLGQANALLAIDCAEVVVSPGNSVPVEGGNVDVPTDAGLCTALVSFVWPTTNGQRYVELKINGQAGILETNFVPVSYANGTVTTFQFIEFESDDTPTGDECNFTVTVNDTEDPTASNLGAVNVQCAAGCRFMYCTGIFCLAYYKWAEIR